MKPIKQDYPHPTRGDCLRACVASLLELDPYFVPQFIELGNENGEWLNHKEFGLIAFIERMGYKFRGRWSQYEALRRSNGINGFFIANVPSANFTDRTHAVIFKEKTMVHDPSPCKQWEGTFDDVIYFFVIEKDNAK